MNRDLERASRSLPGGVNSPVRAFRGVGGEPIFIERAKGAHLFDAEGRRWIDYIGGYGPMILGHSHPRVVEAVRLASEGGQSFGVPTMAEVELAELVLSALPAAEMLRLVNSGTEATMSALRLARAATGRTRVLKFVGCYHGHADPFLVAAGSGLATIGVPSSPGVPPEVTASTLLAPYNDLEAVASLFEEVGDEIAAVIVEPIAGNMGLVPPADGFLGGLRRLCSENGALLIFDEVMTGFRVAWGGVQTLFEIEPDLTCLAKVIGGGLPIGAYAGPRDLMNRIAPAGDVYQAGTLSGNPIAVAAGRATLETLSADDGRRYDRLETVSSSLATGLTDAAARLGVALQVQRQGSMIGIFFADSPVESLADVDASDRDLWTAVFHELLSGGVHLPPSPYETLFVSTAHGEAEVEATVAAFSEALAAASRS